MRHTGLRRGIAAFLFVAGAAFAGGPAITGDWHASVNGQPLALSLAAGGGGSLNGEPIRWSVLGSVLFIEQQGEISAYQFEQQGSRLAVAGGELAAPVTLERGKAAPSSPKGSAGRQSPAAPASGGRAASLVGKWCEAGSFSAVSGGGASHMGCFELRADGSYRYAYEGSMSAYAPGMYGGTASQSGDQGRWSMKGDTITAQSANGTVTNYRLELRNHPKNRDPMICLDGTCYVTYYQKAPW